MLRAAAATAVDPAYLMALADKESSFRPQVHASTSSAAGLFQFVEGTWLPDAARLTVRATVSPRRRGSSSVVGGKLPSPTPAVRQRLLALRHDPYLSAG